MLNKIMLFSILPTFLTLASLAYASGPSNIAGISERLESMTCRGAYWTTKADSEKRIGPAIDSACRSVSDAAAAEACSFSVIKQMSKAAPEALFVGNAVSGQVTFQMSIVDGGKQVFSSLRTGSHGDGVDGNISLNFQRVGVSNDPYMIESGSVSGESDKVSSFMVPIRRRLAPDLVYFFVDGCTLNWAKQNE
ncbi:hypothetical protein WDW37_02150 [Bdellovibrionota bacterium FG-1]